MDRGGDGVARFLVRADRMHRVPHRQQRLERHHGFVVFGIVADQHQQSLAHDCLLGVGEPVTHPTGRAPVLDVLPPLCPWRKSGGWYGNTAPVTGCYSSATDTPLAPSSVTRTLGSMPIR
ncbi:hypothetical protein G6F57_021015 [Rhizopus arrhizus]|nr:hypothetical protein G6F57_021015 [Rhizopus arrhizus]